MEWNGITWNGICSNGIVDTPNSELDFLREAVACLLLSSPPAPPSWHPIYPEYGWLVGWVDGMVVNVKFDLRRADQGHSSV